MLILLSIGQLANVWAGSCGLLLNMTGHQKAAMVITLISSIAAIGAAVWLVGMFGGDGVAAAQAFGLLLQNITMVLYGSKKTRVKTFIVMSPRHLLERSTK